jgi:hypothetical protein
LKGKESQGLQAVDAAREAVPDASEPTVVTPRGSSPGITALLSFLLGVLSTLFVVLLVRILS